MNSSFKRLLNQATKSLAVLAGLWIVGFLWFIVDIPDHHTEVLDHGIDGVVVFTGSPGRVEAGLNFLQAELADRLLISGVDPELAPEVLRPAITRNDKLFECCIDLGRAALDTAGNAREAVAWAKEHGFHRLGIVTADWHIRRGLVEVARHPHDLEIFALPVPTDPSLGRLAVSYNKFLMALVRAIFS